MKLVWITCIVFNALLLLHFTMFADYLYPEIFAYCEDYYYGAVPSQFEGQTVSISALPWPWECKYLASP